MLNLVPVTCTCDLNLEVTNRFVNSFQLIRPHLKPAVIVLDQSSTNKVSGAYLRLLASMRPKVVLLHSRTTDIRIYDSVMWAQTRALQWVLEETEEEDDILFMEDDIEFSSEFIRVIQSYQPPPKMGFLSLYQPEGGFPPGLINPAGFYGAQCLWFRRAAVKAIVAEEEAVMHQFNPGMDIRWSRFLASRGFELYCLKHSYVQHIGPSRMASPAHRARRFVP